MNDFPGPHIRSSWNTEAMLIKGPLTDRKIARYEKQGFYTPELKAYRKEYRERQAKQKAARRSGNFLSGDDGRLIYHPI